ncbi:TOBE domain-containing protein [Streptomyces sp. NPDC050548]|uniref:TOBE domain-containing protein n=1 Tax=Streptomyces sp. NPDC050548 TaxID=3365629 RepID=UPI0037A6B94F
MTMGDRLAVMKDGVLQQVGTPKEVFTRPANTFVAGFIGSPAMNLFRLPLTSHGAQLGGLAVPLTRATRNTASTDGGTEITLGIRPEHLQVLSPDDLDTPALDLVIDTVEDTGAVAYLHATAKLGQDLVPVVVRLPERPTQGKGAPLRVTVRDNAVHCFSAITGLRLAEDTESVPADAHATGQTVSAEAPNPQDMVTGHPAGSPAGRCFGRTTAGPDGLPEG